MPSGENNDPLTMARDKLQSSAREIMRNIETAMSSGSNHLQNKDTTAALEAAFRNIFSSCTGAGGSTKDDQADVTPVSLQPSNESTSLSSRSRSNHSIKESLDRKRTESTGRGNAAREPPNPTTAADPAAHIYEQLFFDDAAKKNKIPDQLPKSRRRRQSNSPQKALVSPTPPQPKKRLSVMKCFPVSSPVSSPARLLTSEEIDIPHCPTFDDGISAISAHTLEAMAKQTQRPPKQARDFLHKSTFGVIPQDISQVNVSLVDSSFSKNSLQQQQRTPTPPQRYGTPQSRDSSKSFEKWRDSEQQFWEREAKKSNKRRGRRKTADSTLSTASSTQMSWKHPHDTLPYEPSDLFFDADMNEIQLDTETGEI
jgi:hypothetical protein